MWTIKRTLGAATSILFLVSVYTPIWNYASSLLRVEPSAARADVIAVLGSGVEINGTLGDESLRRLIHGIATFRENDGAMLVLFGPRPERKLKSEAEVRRDIAERLGVSTTKIKAISEVFSTRDEADEVAALLKGTSGRSVLLVTDSLHMRRALAVFRKHGINAWPAPSDNLTLLAQGPEDRLSLLRIVLRQTGAFLYYKLAGEM